MKPRILDLFCCAGGAAMGYHRAGFDVVGVDINPQPRYPFEFIQADALDLTFRIDAWRDRPILHIGKVGDIGMFDAIHASPPCQRFSDLAKRNGNAHEWPDLIAETRAKLEWSGLPYVIENVEGAPLENPTMLCGTMFGLRVIRHRLFETNFPIFPHPHGKHELCYTRDKRKAQYGKLNEWTSPVQVTGGGNCSKAAAADAMGIDWMTKGELNEAIPPAYTQLIGRRIMEILGYGRIAA